MNHTHLRSKNDLANYLRCPVPFLERLINQHFLVIDPHKPTAPSPFERSEAGRISIQKLYLKKKRWAGGGYREVYSPSNLAYRSVLKILNNYLADLYSPADCVHGYVQGRGILTNAKPHLAKRIVLSIDIENFFESITKERVSECLQQIGFDEFVADCISCITTIDGHLVQGFNTSPTIANIVCGAMDKALLEYCDTVITYTRYADDLYFSTDSELPNIDDLTRIVNAHGFRLNTKKTSIMKRGQRQYVTGLTVFDHKTPRITRRIKRNIRLEVYYINKFGFTKHALRRLRNRSAELGFEIDEEQYVKEEIKETRRRLWGWLSFIYSIEPIVARRLQAVLDQAKR